MSRNNKNAKRQVIAKQWSESRKNGNSGPKQTTPKHGKKNIIKKLPFSSTQVINSKPLFEKRRGS